MCVNITMECVCVKRKRERQSSAWNRDHCWVTLHKVGGCVGVWRVNRGWEHKYYILTSWNTDTHTLSGLENSSKYISFLEIKFYDEKIRIENREQEINIFCKISLLKNK